jgi:hypothetical protein
LVAGSLAHRRPEESLGFWIASVIREMSTILHSIDEYRFVRFEFFDDKVKKCVVHRGEEDRRALREYGRSEVPRQEAHTDTVLETGICCDDEQSNHEDPYRNPQIPR